MKKLLPLNVILLVSITVFSQVHRQVGQAIAGRSYTWVSTGGIGSTIIDKGNIWSWGYNLSGQLNGQQSPDVLLPILTGSYNAIQIVKGDEHTMALSEKGEVWAWGGNDYGQVGTGAPVQAGIQVPTKLLLNNIVSIASGTMTSYAVTANGSVWAWGKNTDGELGIGTISNGQNIPQLIPGLDNVVKISAGHDHTMALKADGTVWAWGSNSTFQLGFANPNMVSSPVKLDSLHDIIDISAGTSFSLALKADGTILAWGYGPNGTLGQGNSLNLPYPKHVLDPDGKAYLNNIVAIETGGAVTSMALSSDGKVYMWGGNDSGELGIGTSGQTFYLPVLNPTLSSVIAISADDGHSLALDASGNVYSWGSNYHGEIGNGQSGVNLKVVTPVVVKKLSSGSIAISSGASHNLALQTNGSVLSWGYNSNGQLGDGSTTDKSSPVQVQSSIVGEEFNDVVAVAGGGVFSLALRADGTVWAWGYNFQGQLGNGNNKDYSNAVKVDKLDHIISIAAPTSGGHALALRSDGTVWTWGANHKGQLGDGTNTNSNIPVQVLELENVIGIAGGEQHSLALKGDGTLWAWGFNYYGQLGNGDSGLNADTNKPVQIKDLNNITSIAAGGGHSLALRVTGEVYAWGLNQDGQLGTGNNISSTTPIQVVHQLLEFKVPLLNVKAIGGGSNVGNGDNSIGLQANGTVWTWGGNLVGELGIGDYSIPSSNIALPAKDIQGVIAVSNVSYHSIILKYAWSYCTDGYNLFGQLGSGTFGPGISAYDCSLAPNPSSKNDYTETTLFPNPLHIGEDLTIIYTAQETEKSFDISIIDDLGVVIFRQTVNCLPGENTVSISTERFYKGIFVVKVGANELRLLVN